VTVQAALQAFVVLMLNSTVRLVRNAPLIVRSPKRVGVASGLLVCDGRDFLLLTAGHIFKRAGLWTLETGVVSAGRSLHLSLRDVQRPDRRRKSQRYLPKDFAWAKILRADARAGLAAAPKGTKLELICYRGPLNVLPNKRSLYGFASWNRVEFHQPIATLLREASFELGMTYERTLSDGTYEFGLARSHQGTKYYAGASGAPIADERGHIVALVLDGNASRNTIIGAPIPSYVPILPLSRSTPAAGPVVPRRANPRVTPL
jgi:hypothetical protein